MKEFNELDDYELKELKKEAYMNTNYMGHGERYIVLLSFMTPIIFLLSFVLASFNIIVTLLIFSIIMFIILTTIELFNDYKLEKYYNEKYDKYMYKFKKEEKIKKCFSKEKFTIDKEFIYEEEKEYGFNAIYVDDKSKRFAVTNKYDDNCAIMNFSELIDFKIVDDGNIIVGSNLGNALIGGLLLGTTGAIVGSQASRTISKDCHKLEIQILLNNVKNPSFTIQFINYSIDRDNESYEKIVRSVSDFVSALTYIKNNAKSKPKKEKSSSADKLKELKQMYNDKTITKKEYEEKKKEIMEKFMNE